jgi:outer membrane protein assembly factor BamB
MKVCVLVDDSSYLHWKKQFFRICMKKLFAFSMMLLPFSMMHAATTCDWPTMNQNFQNTRASPCENTLKTNNVSNLMLKWSFSSPAGVITAPVVKNNIVYFGDLAGNFYAKNLADGTDAYPMTNLGAPCGSAPSISNTTIYVTTADLTLHALNLDLSTNTAFNGGAVVVDPTAAATGLASSLSAPVLVDGVVIVGISNSNSAEATVVNPTMHGTFSAFDINTGAFKWRTQVCAPPAGSCGGSWSTGAVDTNLKLIFAGTTNASSPPASNYTDALLAIDYTTGNIVWSQQYTPNDIWGALYPCGSDFDFGASPNAYTIKMGMKNVDVIGGNSKAMVYRVFKRSDGTPVWSTSLVPSGQVPVIFGNAGAAYANNTVYAVSATTSSTIPQGPFIVLFENGNPSAQALIPGFLAQTNSNIFALNATTGSVLWTTTFPGVTFASITYANGVLYQGDLFGMFRALNASNGQVLFSTNVGGGNTVEGPITISSGNVLVPIAPQSFPGAGGLNVYSVK